MNNPIQINNSFQLSTNPNRRIESNDSYITSNSIHIWSENSIKSFI